MNPRLKIIFNQGAAFLMFYSMLVAAHGQEEYETVTYKGTKYYLDPLPGEYSEYTGKINYAIIIDYIGSYADFSPDGKWIKFYDEDKLIPAYEFELRYGWLVTAKEYFENGNIKRKYYFDDDNKLYKDVEYYEEGKIRSSKEWKNNLLYSKTWHINGGQFTETISKPNPEFNNRWINAITISATSWHENGEIKFKVSYNQTGKQVSSISWYPNGNKREFQNFQDDSIMENTEWHENGKMKSKGKMIYHSKTGTWNYWFPSGKQERIEYRKGYYSMDTILYFDSTGILSKKEKYILTNVSDSSAIPSNDGLGKSKILMGSIYPYKIRETTYWENGKRKSEGEHFGIRDRKMKMPKGYKGCGNNFESYLAKEGIWKFWNREGKLIREEVYEDGVLKETKEYE